MERLAREKITLQQRLSTLKKDMLGKWEHMEWRNSSEEMEYDGNGFCTDSNSDRRPVEFHQSAEESDTTCSINLAKIQPPIIEVNSENMGETHQQLSYINNCHLGTSLSNVEYI